MSKLRALEAYAAGRLSEAGQRRVERLLESSEHRRALAEVRALASVAGDVGTLPVPTLDWDRVAEGLSAAIADEPKQTAERGAGRSRTPRWRALMAYEEGALSTGARETLERFLEASSIDREALAQIRAFAELSGEAEAETAMPPVDFSRMELALRREARSVARQPARRTAVWMVGLAAAAALAVAWISNQPASDTVAEVERPLPTRAPEIAAVIVGEVTAMVGEAYRLDGDALEPIRLGDAVRVDQPLRAEGALHVRLAEGTGFVLEGDAAPTELTEDGITIELRSGRISNQVRTGTRYMVHTDLYEVHVRGTRFEVAVDGEHLSVTLDEGRVELRHRDGARIELLEAPAQWHSAESVTTTALRGDGEGHVATPRDLTPSDEALAPLTIPASDRFVAWEIDGDRMEGAGPLHLRLPAGQVSITAFDTAGRAHQTELELLAEGGTLEERSLRTEVVPGHLEPAVIRAVVAPRQRWLRRCYEHTLRRTHPDLRGRYALRVALARDGRVRQVRVVSSDEAPPAFSRCLEEEARRWSFPSPGGPMHFEVPLNFTSR